MALPFCDRRRWGEAHRTLINLLAGAMSTTGYAYAWLLRLSLPTGDRTSASL
ncbi:MAG: hypothetical protein V7L02_31495 [Nostoc sp.]|uniref:hypothetical protein n=1 Tax=Nostoc sp. TaxID=1180 RepID=UPI002FF92789